MTTRAKNTMTTLLTLAMVAAAYVLCELAIANGWPWMTAALKGQLVNICAWIIMAVSLNLVVGISGELSLGHAGFMSLGAFTGIVIAKWMAVGLQVETPVLRFAAAAVCGVIVAGLAAWLISFPILRLRGDYLAIGTLAFGQILVNVLQLLFVSVEGGGEQQGTLHLVLNLSSRRPKFPGSTDIIKGAAGATRPQQDSTFLIGFILVMITLIVVYNLINSRSGRAIKAIRDNRIAAEAMGLNVKKYKRMAFVTGAALAGLAGVLYGLNQTSLTANVFDYNKSIEVLVYVVLGGIGSIWGSVISATALTILPDMLRAVGDFRMLIYAVVLILVMILTNSTLIKGFINGLRAKRSGAAIERAMGKGGDAA